MKRRTVALLVSLALLSLGLGGCSERCGPCCWQCHLQLVIEGSMESCCKEGAPPVIPGASPGPGTDAFFSPGASATLALARLALEPVRAVVGLTEDGRPHPLYTLECALRL